MTIEVKVGRRLATLRKQAGMTQRQLADAIGTAPEVISRMEHGTHGPSLDRLDEIAQALRVEPRALLDFGGEHDAPPRALDARDRLIGQVTEILRRRSVEQVRAVLRVAEAMEAAPSSKSRRRR